MNVSRFAFSGLVGVAGMMWMGCASQDVAPPQVFYVAPTAARPVAVGPGDQRIWNTGAETPVSAPAAPVSAPIPLPQQAPPGPQAETPPPAPSPTHAWVPGHWVWVLAQYTWAPGYWDLPPKSGAQWKTGQWQPSNEGWRWEPGRWQ